MTLLMFKDFLCSVAIAGPGEQDSVGGVANQAGFHGVLVISVPCACCSVPLLGFFLLRGSSFLDHGVTA